MYSGEAISRSQTLNIKLESEDFHCSPKALQILFSTQSKIDSEQTEHSLWDYLDWIASLFLPELRNLVPQVNYTGKLTLADLQHRQYLQCRLEFHNESPRPGGIYPMDPAEQEDYEGDFDSPGPTSCEWPFPHFQPSDVIVPYSDPTTVFDIVPTKVFVDNRPYFWKPSWISDESRHGLEKYSTIQSSGIPAGQLPTSQLYGIVVKTNGMLCRQLYHWINIQQHLTWDELEKTPGAIRAKWVSQIRSNLSTLHGLGISWGDVKAENVVINEHGNAVVIDLEGGATKGWIDDDKMGTKEGDLQGLERLADYILNDECTLRLRDKELDQHDFIDSES